jgi:hypothetical protein
MTAAVLTYYECFNSKLDEFLKDLTSSFPDIKDLRLVKNGLQLAKNIDVKLPQNFFNEHVALDYEEKIVKKDEDFFLQENYETIVQKHGIDLDIIGRLKDIWAKLGEKDKEIIWKYLHVLIIINRKCKQV